MAKRTRIENFTQEDLQSIHEVARNIVMSDYFREDEIRDVEQELALGLFLESKKFRSRKANWSTFRWRVLAGLAGKIRYDRMKPSACYMRTPVLSLNEEGEKTDDRSDDNPTIMDCVTQDGLLADGTERDGADDMGLIVDVRLFVNSLPGDLRAICDELMIHSPYDAAQNLGIAKSTIYVKIQEIRKRMLEVGLNVYLGVQ